MTRDTLFAHLAPRIGTRQEDLATEALCYILATSSVASEAFVRFLYPTGLSAGSRLIFKTQKTGIDGERPDLIGTTYDAEEVLIVESKFWATLTDNQPVAYLRRLEKNDGKVLLFVVPEKRLDLLWRELLRRVQENGLGYTFDEDAPSRFPIAHLEGGYALAACTWNLLLSHIQRAVEDAGEGRVVADIRQLQGLCQKVDQSAFYPIRSEELSPEIARRIIQYSDVIHEVIQILHKRKLVSDVSKPVVGMAWYGFNITFATYKGARLAFTVWLWSRHASTPLWLILPAAAGKRLAHLTDEQPPEVFLAEGGGAYVPLYLPAGEERSRVISDLVARLERVAKILQGTSGLEGEAEVKQ